MHKKRIVFYLVFMTAVFLFVTSFTVSADSVARISADELKSNLGANGLHVLDVRATCPGDHQGRRGDSARDVALACLDYRLGRAALRDLHRPILLKSA